MPYDELVNQFSRLGHAALLGFLIGLEREIRTGRITLGIRDFVLFALIGAVTTLAAEAYGNYWLVMAGFLGILAFIISSYWAERDHGPGITTELAAVFTFFLGVLVIQKASLLATALAIATLAILYLKDAIKKFSTRINASEIQAGLLFLVITFIALPILPNQTLDHYATYNVGNVKSVDPGEGKVQIEITTEQTPKPGTELELFAASMEYIGSVTILEANANTAIGRYRGDRMQSLVAGIGARDRFGIKALEEALAAINLYRIWLIVVLVSFVSFLGYVLIKVLGQRSGIGLTGLIGGLVSSTVTTLSFAKRSRESPQAVPLIAAAVVLASSVMFPRLLMVIGVFNATLMKNIALPLLVMGVTGLLIAGYFFWRNREQEAEMAPTTPTQFDNPFSLGPAVLFALLFTLILTVTRLATTYLGDAWLPIVSVVSGLTDADAIAFSISNLHRSGLLSTDWASFNLVLGALANTFMKLFLVFGLGHRDLFRRLLVGFLVMGSAGIVTMFLYYDLNTVGF